MQTSEQSSRAAAFVDYLAERIFPDGLDAETRKLWIRTLENRGLVEPKPAPEAPPSV